MVKTCIKRDGREVPFNKDKISKAILAAMKKGSGIVEEEVAYEIANEIESLHEYIVDISTIEKLVFEKLCEKNHVLTARAYENYRTMRETQKQIGLIDGKVLGLINASDDELMNENSNKNSYIISTQRDLVSEEVSKDISIRTMFPPHIAQAHIDGLIHLNDLGHYVHRSFNCCLINLKDMLDNGTVINKKMVQTPKSFQTACTITTQIIAQVASGQFGGQSITISHLSPYLKKTEDKIRKEVTESFEELGFEYNEEKIEHVVQKRLRKELNAGIQTIQYQINTLNTSNGQSPFLTIFLWIGEDKELEKYTAMIIEEVLKQRIQGMQNEAGAWVAPAFPKLIYVLDDNNLEDDSEYFYITELACECVTKRMMPDFISAKMMRENYEGNVFPPMGCRAFLSPYKGPVNNNDGEYKFWGRFNMGVTSINLPDIALSADGDIEKFWEIFEERMELVKESLLLRYERLLGTKAKVSPIHYQHGCIARLGPEDTIDELISSPYATITVGYVGVYETVKFLIGESNTTEEGEKLALAIVQYMKDKVLKWKEEYGLGFALYGTPSESLTDKFARCLQKRFGEIEGITDHLYITNSFHVNVREEIDAFKKIEYEGKFHKISSGGCISYVEVPNLIKNPSVILELIRYGYDKTVYLEFNSKLDHCHECNFEGEIQLDENYEWVCPNCGNRNHDKMTVVRRTCGYLGKVFALL